MKKALTLIGATATMHFLLYWAIVGILHLSGFELNFVGPSNNPRAADFLFSLLGVLLWPVALLPSPASDTVEVALFLLNSTLWGILLGGLLCAVKRTIQKIKQLPAARA